VLVNAGSPATKSSAVALAISWPATAAVTQVRVSNTDTLLNGLLKNSKLYAVARTIPWNLADPTTGGSASTGTKRVYVQFGDGGGSWSAPVTDSITYDTARPALQPTWTWTVPGTAQYWGTPLMLEWTAADSGSGIDHFNLEWQCAPPSSPMTQVELGPTDTSFVVDCPVLSMSLEAVDKAGNTREVSWPGATAHSPFLLGRTGTWSDSTAVPFPTSFTGSRIESSEAGATASYSGGFYQAAVVFLTGPSRGEVNIYVDGVLDATVDTFSPVAEGRRVLWAKPWPYATHTISLEVVGTAGRPSVVIEGVLRAPVITP
jgi:hypothetical protein